MEEDDFYSECEQIAALSGAAAATASGKGATGCASHIACRLTTSASSSSALFLSPVWPEPSSSAAGVRSSELMAGLQRWGFVVDWAAAAAPNEHASALAARGVRALQVPPNREAALAGVLADVQPSIVIFDRCGC